MTRSRSLRTATGSRVTSVDPARERQDPVVRAVRRTRIDVLSHLVRRLAAVLSCGLILAARVTGVRPRRRASRPPARGLAGLSRSLALARAARRADQPERGADLRDRLRTAGRRGSGGHRRACARAEQRLRRHPRSGRLHHHQRARRRVRDAARGRAAVHGDRWRAGTIDRSAPRTQCRRAGRRDRSRDRSGGSEGRGEGAAGAARSATRTRCGPASWSWPSGVRSGSIRR